MDSGRATNRVGPPAVPGGITAYEAQRGMNGGAALTG
jgi:hypothetical protein